MECDVLHIQLGVKAPARPTPDIRWVSRKDTANFFANSFSLKALGKIL